MPSLQSSSAPTTLSASAGALPFAALALAVTAVWGFNFVVIKIGTDGVPPLLLAGLRFAFLCLPAVFSSGALRPRGPWSLPTVCSLAWASLGCCSRPSNLELRLA